MGINLNMPEQQVLKIDKPATSILAETGNITTITDTSDILLHHLNKFEQMMLVKSEENVYRIWKSENKLIGKNISITFSDDKTLEVKVLDIKETGQLYVIDKGGNFHSVFSGDITVSKF